MGVMKWAVRGLAGLAAVVGLALAGWHVLDSAPRVAAPVEAPGQVDLSRLLVLVDGDMAATAYADGNLRPIDGADDLLVRIGAFDPDAARDTPTPASNTVMGWPGAMTADPAGRFAHVVESRAAAPEGVARFDNLFAEMPVGRLLTTVDLASGAVVATTEVCPRPNSVDIAPNGRWLLVACGDPGGELAVVPLTDGRPGAPRRFDLDLPDLNARPGIDDGLSYAMVHPSGAAAGVIVSNVAVGLVRFDLDAAGVPVTATAEPPVTAGNWLSVGRWTRAGGHFLVADVGWGPRPTDAVLNGDGAILSLALSPDGAARGVVSSAPVSKSPEAFELNRAGDRLVAVNMERTYLPGGLLSVIPGRGASSLSLVAVEDATGTLVTLGEPVGFRGVLPEDAVFDADGDRILVVVYQDHDAPLSDGWVEVFAVEGDAIRPTGTRLPLPRGAHDLFALD